MFHLYTNEEYTSSKLLVRYPLTSYIPSGNIPVVDTEGYWLWNSENFAVWNWRQPAPYGNWTDGGEVPSQAGTGIYRVQLAKKFATCECPDFSKRKTACKHIFAATFVSRRENPDGSVTVTQTVALAQTETTYPQAWAAYNEAQTNEKDKFQMLLSDLCNGLPLGPQVKKNGRPSLPLSDMIFSATFKVYSTISARRFMSDLREAQSKGFPDGVLLVVGG